MSFSISPLQAVAGFITGALLTPGAMSLGQQAGHKLSETEQPSAIPLPPLRGVGAIAGAALLVGHLESQGAASPFHEMLHLTVKVYTIELSILTGGFFGLAASLVLDADLTITQTVSIGLGQIISIITSVFLAVMSLSIHPMLGPVVGGATNWALSYIFGMIVLRI